MFHCHVKKTYERSVYLPSPDLNPHHPRSIMTFWWAFKAPGFPPLPWIWHTSSKLTFLKNLTFILSFPYPLGTLASFRFWPGLVFLTPLHWFPSLPAAPPFTSPGTQPSWPGAQESINTSSMAMGTVFRQTNCSLCLLGTWGQQLKHSHNSIPKTGDCYLDAQGDPSQDIII